MNTTDRNQTVSIGGMLWNVPFFRSEATGTTLSLIKSLNLTDRLTLMICQPA